MKKKIFIPLLFAGLLTMGSCNDINDMSVDFGDRTYINEYKGLINSINDLNTSLSERFNALGIILEKGLANIQVAIDKNTGEITILNQSVNDGLGTINTTLFNGFTTVAQQIDATGKTIVAAIDSNGNLLRLQIDATGKLISAQLITSTEDLIKVMKENNTSLAEKLGLIDAAIKAGFANEKTSLDAVETAINNLKTEVQNGNTSNANYLAQLVSGLTALNTTMGTTNTKLDEIKDVLTKQLADDGVTINTDGKSVLVTPEIWAEIEQGGTSSQLYNVFMQAIATVTVPYVNNPIQVTPGTWHKCARFVNDGYDENTVALRAGTLQPTTAANGKTVIKVIKTPSEVKFHIANLDNCTYQWLYNIRVYDARGDYQVYGGTYGNSTGSRAQIGEATTYAIPSTPTHGADITIRLKAYDNGRICEDIKAYVFSYQYTSTLPTLFWPSSAPSN